MSKLIKMLALITIVLTTFVACNTASEPNTKPAPPDAFAVNKMLGRGINLGNALDAPEEGAWGLTLKEEYFQAIKDAGFDSVRLPVRWSAHAMDEPPYTIDPAFFNRVDWAVNCALSRDLPVILNVHHYNELFSDPAKHKDRFLALWKQIAEHYRDYPDTLLFEPLNEPQGKLLSAWNQLLNESIAVIRETNPNRTIVADPGNVSTMSGLKYLMLPENDRHIIVTVHYYAPLEFTHQGAPWVTDRDSNSWLGTKWTGNEKEKRAVLREFDIAAEWVKKNNRPINLGEFGTYEKADMDSRVRWTKFVADTAIERGMSFHYWQFGSNLAVYDIETNIWIKPLLDALLPSKK